MAVTQAGPWPGMSRSGATTLADSYIPASSATAAAAAEAAASSKHKQVMWSKAPPTCLGSVGKRKHAALTPSMNPSRKWLQMHDDDIQRILLLLLWQQWLPSCRRPTASQRYHMPAKTTATADQCQHGCWHRAYDTASLPAAVSENCHRWPMSTAISCMDRAISSRCEHLYAEAGRTAALTEYSVTSEMHGITVCKLDCKPFHCLQLLLTLGQVFWHCYYILLFLK